MKQKKILRYGMIDDYVRGEPKVEKADPFGSFRIFLWIHWYPFSPIIVSQRIHEDPKGSIGSNDLGSAFSPLDEPYVRELTM
jgi:hypothetical protein